MPVHKSGAADCWRRSLRDPPASRSWTWSPRPSCCSRIGSPSGQANCAAVSAQVTRGCEREGAGQRGEPLTGLLRKNPVRFNGQMLGLRRRQPYDRNFAAACCAQQDLWSRTCGAGLAQRLPLASTVAQSLLQSLGASRRSSAATRPVLCAAPSPGEAQPRAPQLEAACSDLTHEPAWRGRCCFCPAKGARLAPAPHAGSLKSLATPAGEISQPWGWRGCSACQRRRRGDGDATAAVKCKAPAGRRSETACSCGARRKPTLVLAGVTASLTACLAQVARCAPCSAHPRSPDTVFPVAASPGCPARPPGRRCHASPRGGPRADGQPHRPPQPKVWRGWRALGGRVSTHGPAVGHGGVGREGAGGGRLRRLPDLPLGVAASHMHTSL